MGNKGFLVGNIRVKLMALAMAVALWFFAVNRYTEVITEVVDVEISMPAGFTMLNQSAANVIISLKGPQELIDQVSGLIAENKIKARCRIPYNTQGTDDLVKESIALSRENLNLPDSIRVESIYPEKIEVELSRLEKKRLKVVIVKEGQPAPGFIVKNEFIYPSDVEVVGPANILKSVTQINTALIDINGVSTEKNRTFPWIIDIEQSVQITNEGETETIPVKCNDNVRVWFVISELQEVKTLEKVKVSLLQSTDFPYHVTLQDQNIDLVIKGSKMAIDKLNPDDVVAYVDVSTLKPPGPYKQPVHVNLPVGVEVKDQIPEIHVDLKENESAAEGLAK